MRPTHTKRLVLALVVLALVAPARAGVKSRAAREAAEVVLERFGKQLAGKTVETLARGSSGWRCGTVRMCSRSLAGSARAGSS